MPTVTTCDGCEQRIAGAPALIARGGRCFCDKCAEPLLGKAAPDARLAAVASRFDTTPEAIAARLATGVDVRTVVGELAAAQREKRREVLRKAAAKRRVAAAAQGAKAFQFARNRNRDLLMRFYAAIGEPFADRLPKALQQRFREWREGEKSSTAKEAP